MDGDRGTQQQSAQCRAHQVRAWPKHSSTIVNISPPMVLDKCNNYSCPLVLYIPRNRAGSLNRKLLCSEPSLESGNGLYRPSHLFYFLENDEGPSSIAPSHQTSLHWNHHSTHIRGIIWLQLCSTVIVGSLPDKLGAIKPLNKRQVQSHTDKSLLSDREWKRDGEMGD